MEIELTGVNEISYPFMASWEWQIPLYLFLGGLVAGLMILGPALRLRAGERFQRAIWVSDLAALPVLAVGMLFLWLDLANRWNAWRFYATFQLRSAMSWGAWILLLTMIVLGLRLLSQLPGFGWWESRPRNRFLRVVQAPWRWLMAWGRAITRQSKFWDGLTIILGLGLGFYTGLLLSTIPARPLWNSAILAPLFLVSGLASGGAFLALFIPRQEEERLTSFFLLLGGVELLMLLAYLLSLLFGGLAAQRAGQLLTGDLFGGLFWGLVIGVGLLLPVLAEALAVTGHHLPRLASRLPALLTLTGGAALRFVIVFAGLQSFV